MPGLRVGAGRTHHPVSDGSNSLGSFTEDRGLHDIEKLRYRESRVEDKGYILQPPADSEAFARAHAVSHLGATANDTLSVYSYSGDGVAGSLCLAGCAGHTPPTMR